MNWVHVLGVSVLVLVILLLLAFLLVNRALGFFVRKTVEKDTGLLGVAVEVGNVQIKLHSGHVGIFDVIIHNPEGYVSDYLLKAAEVTVDVDMRTYISSGGNKLVLRSVMLNEVDVIYEVGLGTTNVGDLLAYLNREDSTKLPNQEELLSDRGSSRGLLLGTPTAYSTRDLTAGYYPGKTDATEEPSGTEVELHRVIIEGAGVQVAASTKLAPLGARILVADIRFDDCKEEFGSVGSVEKIIEIVLQSLLKSVMDTLAGHKLREGLGAGFGQKANGRACCEF